MAKTKLLALVLQRLCFFSIWQILYFVIVCVIINKGATFAQLHCDDVIQLNKFQSPVSRRAGVKDYSKRTWTSSTRVLERRQHFVRIPSGWSGRNVLEYGRQSAPYEREKEQQKHRSKQQQQQVRRLNDSLRTIGTIPRCIRACFWQGKA